MIQFSLPASAASTLSRRLRTRGAIAAPAFVALLALCSSARAEEPAAAPAAPTQAATPSEPAPQSAPPAPAAAAPAVAAPAVAAPAVTAPAVAAPAVTEDRGAIALTTDDLPARVQPRVHEGLYMRLGSGPSVSSFSGHGPTGDASLTNSGAGGFLAIGGAVAPGLVLAGVVQGTEINAEFKGGPFAHATVTSDGKTRTASNRAEGGFGMLGMLVDWYPQPKAGWHAGLAAGVGALALTNRADDSDIGGVNFAGSVFGGYDWALGRKWSLGLQLTASGATTTKMKEDFDGRDTGYRLTPVSVGVQASLLYF